MPESILFEKTKLGEITDTKPARLTIEEFDDPRLFVTNISGGSKPNYQLMYSLGDDIFLNTFSERLSMWDLQGLHILSDCNGNDVEGDPPFLKFYREYNIKTGLIVKMSFAGIVMKGFLVDMRIEDYNQNGVEGFKFYLKYLALLQNLVGAGNTKNIPGSNVPASEEGTPQPLPSELLYASLEGDSTGADPVRSSGLSAIEGLA